MDEEFVSPSMKCLGLILRLHTEVGDFVEQDEEIATIETDKVSS